jgi:hypothetical protein
MFEGARCAQGGVFCSGPGYVTEHRAPRSPNLACNLHKQFKLGALRVLGNEVAFAHGDNAALPAQRLSTKQGAVRTNPTVDPKIAWAKLQAMAEGARIASERLW